jgi:hypothetical protein
MRDRIVHLLRYVVLVFAFGVASFVVARPMAAFQVVLGPPVAVDKPSGTGQYTLSGTVVDALTGAPIHRALVQLVGPQSRLVLTDEGGKFRFANLAQGQNGINVHKPGYTDSAGNSAIMVTIGADTSPLVLKLEPESAITLRVKGEDGDGVEGLPVRVLMSQVGEGRRHLIMNGGGETDGQGEYRFGGLRPGKYYVTVGPSRRPIGHVGDGAHESDIGYSRVFYPNAAELEGAAQVEVSSGRRARVEFSLSTVPLYRISGVVVGGTPGQPCYAQIVDSSGQQIGNGVGINAVTGMFRSGGVPGGFYTLTANCVAEGGIYAVARMPLHVDSNIANVTLSVTPTASIAVIFRTNESGAEANENRFLAMVLLTRKQSNLRGHGSEWAQREGDGPETRLVVKRVEPGIYSADIRPNSGWYVESAVYGSVDLLREDLTVPEGGTTDAIEITLRNDGARVSGTVRGKGAASATGLVLLVSSRAPREVKATQVVNGTFTLDDLAPGSYRAIAIDQADDLEYTNPEVLRDYMMKAQDVTLGPKQESRLDLELVHREK